MMMRLQLMVGWLFAAVSMALPGGAAAQCHEAALLDDHLIIRTVEGGTTEAFILAFEANHPDIPVIGIADSIPDRNLFLLEIALPDGLSEDRLDALEDDIEEGYPSLIEYGEFLYDDEAPEGKSGSTFVDSVGGTFDTFNGQYAHDNLGLDLAHQFSTGLGTVVAVLDTGVDPDMTLVSASIAPGGFNFMTGTPDTADVGDGMDNDNDGLTDEMVGHGTFVASLVKFVAPDAKILPIVVVDSEGRGDLWTLAKGMYHAIDQGVEVINISISSTYDSEAVEDAILEARNLGIVVVAAAGNCNYGEDDDDEIREFPAMSDFALGVAALDDEDVKAPFSNYNDKLFISAPGATKLIGGEPDPDAAIVGLVESENYVFWEGTSMASPLVAGAAALLRAQNPQWAPAESTYWEVRNRLAAAAVDVSDANPGVDPEYLGAGRAHAGDALQFGPPAPDPADLDASGAVDVTDLLTLLGDWGLTHSSADLGGDGDVGVGDLLLLLSAWG